MRASLLAVCATVLGGAAAAQTPRDETTEQVRKTIEQKLASEEPSDVAWGGYLVNRDQLRTASRALTEALQRWRTREGFDARCVRLHLVDGLVGIDARLPAEQVEFLLDDPLTCVAAFAVICNEPIVNQAAIANVAMSSSLPRAALRTAAAQFLVAHDVHAPGFAAFLLEQIRPRFLAIVRAPGAEDDNGTWNSAVGLGGRLRRPSEGVLAGFPPLVRHSLAGGGEGTKVRLVSPAVGGLEADYLMRSEVSSFTRAEFDVPKGRAEFDGNVAEILLRSIVPQQEDYFRVLVHEWRDAATYLAEVTAARDALRRDLDDLVLGLRERGWLERTELTDFRVPLEERFQDERKRKELPALPELPSAGQARR